MVEGADVTIRYKFLPTDKSIRESANKVVNQLNKVVGKPITTASAKRLTTEFDKTTNSIINLLRATQQKTSLQTKILSGMKFIEGGGITGGAGGGAAGGIAGGGMMAALGTIAALLVIIVAAMAIISAFFDAVGPIIKVVMKMLSAVILILLMPFLKRGLPVLFGILKWIIEMSKGISTFVDEFLTYMEGVFEKVKGGDLLALVEFILGPAGMLGIFLLKKLAEFLASVDWDAVIRAIIPLVQASFAILMDMINVLGATVFGGDLWKQIKDAIDFIATQVFGEGIWNEIKNLVTGSDGVVDKFIAIRDALGEFLAGLINVFNTLFGPFGLSIAHPQTGAGSGSASISITDVPGGIPGTGETRGPRGETIAERDARVAGYIAGGIADDFISRDGKIQKFNSGDTIIGTKTPGGVNITNNLNVSAGVDKNEFRKILDEFNRQQAREMRSRTSYYGR